MALSPQTSLHCHRITPSKCLALNQIQNLLEMVRKKIVAGNWKMNKSYDEGIALVEQLVDELDMDKVGDTHIIIAPPSVLLQPVTELLIFSPSIAVAAQNCHHEESGAFTGEISAAMIKSVDADAVIVGHSERREYFKEDDALISKKMKAVLDKELIVIYCCGESFEERKTANHIAVVEKQLRTALSDFSAKDAENIIVAYEPVWAIGTGEVATVAQAGEMHTHIRTVLSSIFGDAAQNMSILYGGSVKPDNAAELFTHPDIDGGLIGGASLKSADFMSIIYAMPQ